MKRVSLSGGKFAIVSDCDFPKVNRYKWSADRNGYAVRMVQDGSRRRKVLMHRFILDAPAGAEVDHANGDKLDNRRSNLRLATKSQNNANRGPYTGTYKGVSWHKRDRRWQSQIRINGSQRHLGTFADPVSAALAYDRAARAAWGEFAYLNFPNVTEGTNGDD